MSSCDTNLVSQAWATEMLSPDALEGLERDGAGVQSWTVVGRPEYYPL